MHQNAINSGETGESNKTNQYFRVSLEYTHTCSTYTKEKGILSFIVTAQKVSFESL